MRRALTLLAVLAATWLAAPVRADDPLLGTIDVTAPRGENATSDATASATVVPITTQPGEMKTLADVLDDSVGVQVRHFGGLGDFSTISIRGSSPGQVGFFLDGIPLTRARSDTVNLADLPLDELARVEVYRGTSPLAFSSSALAGVVNLVTREPTDAPQFTLLGGGGSFGTRKAVVTASDRHGPWSGLLTATYLGSEGNFSFHDDNGTPLNPSDDQTTDRKNNAFNSGELLGKLRYTFAGGATLTGVEEAYANHQGVPGIGAFQSDDASLRELRSLSYLRLEGHPFGQANLDGGVTGYYVYEREQFRDVKGEIGVGSVATRNQTDSGGLDNQLVAHLGGHDVEGRLDAGGEVFHPVDELAPDPNGPDQARIRLDVAVGDTFSLFDERFLVQPSFRYEHIHDDFGGTVGAGGLVDNRTQGGDIDLVTPRLGLRFDWTSRIGLRGNAGRYARAPTFSELFGNRGIRHRQSRPQAGERRQRRPGRRLHPRRRRSLQPSARRGDRLRVVRRRPDRPGAELAAHGGAAKRRERARARHRGDAGAARLRARAPLAQLHLPGRARRERHPGARRQPPAGPPGARPLRAHRVPSRSRAALLRARFPGVELPRPGELPRGRQPDGAHDRVDQPPALAGVRGQSRAAQLHERPDRGRRRIPPARPVRLRQHPLALAGRIPAGGDMIFRIRGRPALAATLLAVVTASCGGGGGGTRSSTPPPTGEGASVFVVTTDFDTGSFSLFPVGHPEQIARSPGDLHSDAVARTHGGIVYVVNRLGGDNIQAIDPAQGWTTVWQCSVGNGTNPHDILVVAPDKAYVTLYERAGLAIVDPSVGPSCAGFLRGSIDLSALADADGIPEMDQMALIGERLYVSLERLNRRNFFQPTDSSVLAVVDTTSDTLIDVDPTTAPVDGIRLAGTNPFTESQGLTVDAVSGDIFTSSVGSFGTIGDGGIERVDTRTNRSAGFIVSETDLGANITDFVLIDAHRAYALLLGLDSINRLVRFDPSTRAITATLLTSEDFLVDIAFEPTRRELYVTDRTLARPGIRIFSTGDDREVTATPVDTGLPPFDIVFVGEDVPAPPPPIVVPAGFYVGATTEGQPISLQTGSIEMVYLVCGGRTVRANAGGSVAANGAFAVTVDGVSIAGQFDAQGGVTGTLAGGNCSADFTATFRAGAVDSDGDGIPDLVDPDPVAAVCGNGVRESGEACDGSDEPCGAGAHCVQCRCESATQPTPSAQPTSAPLTCTTDTVTIDLATAQPIGAATLLLDYPQDAVTIPGSGDATTVKERITVLTSAALFGNGEPNDQDDRVRFTLIAVDGLPAGPLFAVRFDCLGAPPAARTFTCTVTDAVAADGVTPVTDATCTLHVRSE